MIKLHSQVTFSKEIERQAKEKQVGLIEAIVDYCTESGIDIESVGKLLTAPLKARLREEAEDLHFIEKKGNKLDFLE